MVTLLVCAGIIAGIVGVIYLIVALTAWIQKPKQNGKA